MDFSRYESNFGRVTRTEKHEMCSYHMNEIHESTEMYEKRRKGMIFKAFEELQKNALDKWKNAICNFGDKMCGSLQVFCM